MLTEQEKIELERLLNKLRNEEIRLLAIEYDMTEDEIREKLDEDPEEIYEMDDGDCLIQGIDTVLGAKW